MEAAAAAETAVNEAQAAHLAAQGEIAAKDEEIRALEIELRQQVATDAVQDECPV